MKVSTTRDKAEKGCWKGTQQENILKNIYGLSNVETQQKTFTILQMFKSNDTDNIIFALSHW